MHGNGHLVVIAIGSLPLFPSFQSKCAMHFCFVEPSDLSLPPLILLHGSGGTETDMLPVAAAVSPTSSAFSVRGAVTWEDGFAFFKRFRDRRIDENSIRAEAPALAALITDIVVRHPSGSKPILIGFSNGAIMAAALVMMFPDLVRGAALLRPLAPFAAPPTTRLQAMRFLVIDAISDDRRNAGDGVEMALQLRNAGAAVDHHSVNTGHDLADDDLAILRRWLADVANVG